MAWYFHLFKNFPQFVVIHTVKGFSIVSEEDVDVFILNFIQKNYFDKMKKKLCFAFSIFWKSCASF